MGGACSSGRPRQVTSPEPVQTDPKPAPPAPEEPDPNDKETLQVKGVDFRVSQNTKDHRTDEYDITSGSEGQLVVRRGQQFSILIHFSRPYNSNIDELRLVFQAGANPTRNNGTHVEIVLSDKDKDKEWGAKLTQQSDKSIEVTVFTPPQCFVGQWHFKVDVVKKKDNKVSLDRYTHPQPIYMLFNPWCKDDAVYLVNPDELEEYVLNDKGRIYAGSYFRITSKPWVFGQFTGKVLDCCMYLLEKCQLRDQDRGNAILVVRRLTAVVNSPDDVGVLTGNWSGNYEGGKSPLSWTGSEPILDQYLQQKMPVKYGQCWVFSGVLTTVCRALGLPARSITNFSSAHDVDASITIDRFVDVNGNRLKDLAYDSVWNFHVWNEVWMARPDLPQGYGGWQACDATPQERSQGVFCCGPCSVRAIKEGEVSQNYDGPFIFAEVNADRVTWMVMDDGSKKKVKVEKTSVGKYISTKSLKWGREDVTEYYKHEEGSTAERVAIRRAQELTSSPYDHLEEESPEDVDFKLLFDADNTYVGDQFTLKLRCHNSTSESRTVAGTVYVRTMYYTGVEADEVVTHNFQDVQLEPGKDEHVEVDVADDAYLGKLKDMCMLSFTVLAKVTETGQIFTQTDHARLRKPHLQIQGPSSIGVGQEFEVQVSFTNPMSRDLTKCYLELEAPGFTKATKHPQSDVDAKQAFTQTLKLTAKKPGAREIVVIFNSKQLEDVNGTHDITVTK